MVSSSSPYKQGSAMLLIQEAGWNGKADYARCQKEGSFGDRNCMRMRDLLSHCPLFFGVGGFGGLHNHGCRLPALAGLCFRTRKLWIEKRKPLVGSKDQIVPRALSPTQIPSTSTSTLKQRRCKYTVRLSDSSKMSVTLHTNLGDIKLEVFCESVPKTAEVDIPTPTLQTFRN